MANQKNMNAQEILEILPHRYPFVLVDGILEYDEDRYIVGYKNITLNEPYIYGHPTMRPSFPEALITESMCQVGAVGVLNTPQHRGKIMLFAAIDDLRFYNKVYPGEVLITKVERIYMKGNLGKMKGQAYVKDKLIAEGAFSYALTERKHEAGTST